MSHSESIFSSTQYVKWYKDMLLMRRFEEKVGQLYTAQKFGGFCHLYIGQEAVVAGTISATRPTDKHMTAYRAHVHPVALGTDVKILMAELFGRITGCSKGKGGSMHFFDKTKNFMGGHGIVGAQIAMGAGVAFAEKYQGTDNVCIVSMGDGAARQGILHETFNMAMLWKLPAIFLIENNRYAMGTSVERTTNVLDLSQLGASYLMPSEVVDGMSVEAVHHAVERAAQRARAGQGPTLLDVRTYRYKGHSMSDPQKYRTKEELEAYKSLDPIDAVLKIIQEKKYLSPAEVETIEQTTKNLVEEAVTFAENSPLPTADELYKDVYVQADYPFITE